MEANVQNAVNTVVKAESWLKQHQTLLIVVVLAIISYFLLDKGLNVVASWEQHRASVAAAQVANDKAKNDAALDQAKQTLQEYKTVFVQTAKDNATLQQGIKSRDALLAAQQKKDVALPPSALGERWSELVGDTGIQADTSGFTVSNTAALATVSKLEQVPVLEQDVKDEQTKSANLQKDVTKANDLISQGTIVVNGLQLQLTDQTKACTAQVAAVKAEARKGKLKSFGIGFGIGFLTGLTAHFW